VLQLWLLSATPVVAQSATQLVSLGKDDSGQVERYEVTLGRGATLWDLAQSVLPLLALDKGDQQAYQTVLTSFQQTFPSRSPNALQPGDSFVLEVPVGTFVSQQSGREGRNMTYSSYQGDQLTVYPRGSPLLYRLVRHDQPDEAEVHLAGQTGSPVDLARAIYGVDTPDFVQVRVVRAALSDPSQPIVVDQNHPYLDDFRNYRDQATSVNTGSDGMQVYQFAADDQANPFERVEDVIGDATDPGAFPQLVRLAFYRDGSVRKYMITQPGDSLSPLNLPDTARWHQVLPDVVDWQTGTVEPLPPFSPAVNQDGALLPDRILVLHFVPQPRESATASTPSASGLSCAGVPVAIVVVGALCTRKRRSRDRAGGCRVGPLRS
jgi:hypothetical protein